MASINGKISLDAGIINNQHLKSDADIRASKMRHIHKPGCDFGLAIGETPVAEERLIYVAKGAAIVRNFQALLADTGTATDVDFDLKKNDVSILSALPNVTHSQSDGQVVTGTLSDTTLVAGDRLSIELVVTSSTGAQGPFAWTEIEEVLGT